MAVITQRIARLDQVPINHEKGVVYVDGDNTLFRAGTADVYPDVANFLRRYDLVNLVSANPDSGLADERVSVIQEHLPNDSETRVFHPDKRAQWLKHKLYKLAAHSVLADGNPAAVHDVIGDRWLADVVSGRRAVAGVLERPYGAINGYVIRRSDAAGDIFTDPLVRKVEHLTFDALRKKSPKMSERLVGSYHNEH